MRKNLGVFACAFSIALFISGCKSESSKQTGNYDHPHWIRACNKKLTDVIVTDIFTPPVACRIYAYSNIAAYEVLANAYPDKYRSLTGQLNQFDSVARPEKNKPVNWSLSALVAFSTVAQKLIYSEFEFDNFIQQYIDSCKKESMDDSVIAYSVSFGKAVGTSILNLQKGDNFAKSRTFPRYTLLNQPGKWVPTPPDYMDGIESFWNTIRSFSLDSASEFMPPRPLSFDSVPGSEFFEMVKEVYNKGNTLTEGEKEIARYWDDNPFVSETHGHLKYFNKKTTPPGHWMNICSLISKIKQLDIIQTSELYLFTAMAMHDGFISCWDEKYRSNLIRPVSYINTYMDKNWQSFLQTPPFPEYTSGHSTISAAAATIISGLVGDNITFIDSSQVEYGFPVRSFNSFMDAADECSISRFYGGIHYMNSVQEGNKAGKLIAKNLVEKVKTKNSIASR